VKHGNDLLEQLNAFFMDPNHSLEKQSKSEEGTVLNRGWLDKCLPPYIIILVKQPKLKSEQPD
jgi:hypothetical protein